MGNEGELWLYCAILVIGMIAGGVAFVLMNTHIIKDFKDISKKKQFRFKSFLIAAIIAFFSLSIVGIGWKLPISINVGFWLIGGFISYEAIRIRVSN